MYQKQSLIPNVSSIQIKCNNVAGYCPNGQRLWKSTETSHVNPYPQKLILCGLQFLTVLGGHSHCGSTALVMVHHADNEFLNKSLSTH